MIAKGNLHAHGVKLAAYLTASDAEQRAELVELRGFAATNIRDAFVDVQIQAAATRAEKPFFHAYVRAPEGEALTREAWLTFADRLEKRLGFTGQPRAVAFHHGADGETHMHIAWSRIDLATMTAIDPGLYKNKMKQLCREFEQEYGLTRVANERGADVKTRSADRSEFEQSRRLGTDLKAIRNTIHECWQSADNGRAFAAALEQQGLILARGDRRDFVIIDRDGGDHALSKRITGATAAETRGRMADIDRASLPRVADAKASQHARGRTRRSERTKIGPDAAREHITGLWRGTDSGAAFQAALEQSGWVLARGDRREFVAIDPKGGTHSLARRIAGATAKDVRARLAGLDMSKLPSVAAVMEARRARRPVPEARRTTARDPVPVSRGKPPPIRVIGGIARPAGRGLVRPAAGVVNAVGKVADRVATALEGLLGGGPSKPKDAEQGAAPDDDRRPLDAGRVPPQAEIDEAILREQEQKTARRHRYLREFSRDVPQGLEADAEIERDRKGRERER